MGKHPHLPVELIIQILGSAIYTSQETAVSISLVCSWARDIALAVVWKAVIVRPTFQIAGSYRRNSSLTHLNQRTDTFPAAPAPLVRAIWADKTRLGERSIRSVFDLCRSAIDLALSWDRFRDLSLSQYLYKRVDLHKDAEFGYPHPDNLHYPRPHRDSPCRRLTILGPWVLFMVKDSAFTTRTGCSVFLNLTHLRLTDFTNRQLPVDRMPNLTHLAVPPSKRHGTLSDTPPGPAYLDCRGVLDKESKAPSFQVIVLTADLAVEKRPLAELQVLLAGVDERLYIVHAPCKVHHVKPMWERAARGGETIWDQAVRERLQSSGV